MSETDRVKRLNENLPKVRIPDDYVAPKKLCWSSDITNLLMHVIDTIDDGKFKALREKPYSEQEIIYINLYYFYYILGLKA